MLSPTLRPVRFERIAMMTTKRPDGHLCSRAMATQKRAAGADLWFVTAEARASSEKSPSIHM